VTAIRFISADEIRPHLNIDRLINSAANAFQALSGGKAQAPVYVLHPNTYADLHVKSAVLAGCPIFTVKMAGWSQLLADRGEAPASGLIAVFDADTCRPVAILQDDHLVSDYRTAAAGALAAKMLAREGASTVTVVGTGTQARLQAQAAALVRPVESIRIWGRTPRKSAALATALSTDLPGVEVKAQNDLEKAVRSADIIITATNAKGPIIEGGWLRPGQHITSVGSDDAFKCELAPSVLAAADLVVVDAFEPAEKYGNIHRAVNAGLLKIQSDVTEIGAILNGVARGRCHESDLTVASFVGLGIQDLTAVQTLLADLDQK